MRAAAVIALAASGCLSEPGGRPQVWPPPDVDVVSAAAVDLDDDGLDDLVVLSAGAADVAGGVYLLRGGADLALEEPGVATTFTALAALEIGRPAKLLLADLDGDQRREIVVTADLDGDDLFVATFDGDLTPRATAPVGTGSVSDDDRLQAFVVPYPAGPELVVLGADTARRAAAEDFAAGGSPDFQDVDLIGIPITDPDLVITHHDQGMDTWSLVLAGPTGIHKNTLSPGGMPEASWTQIRGGTIWPQQVAVDLGGPATIEVVGLKNLTGNEREICAHDVYAELPIACAPVGPIPRDARAVLTGDLLPGGGLDLAVLADDLGAVPLVITNLGLGGGAVTHEAIAIWQDEPLDAWAFAAVDHRLVVVGSRGELTCAELVGGNLRPCTPPE